MKLRDATPADLDAIWELETGTFGAEAWSRETMRSEIEGEHRRYVVLEDDDGRVRGYAGLLVIGEDGDIQTIAVAEDARGGGHGRRLMTELLDEAERRGAARVFLEVRADNPVAHGLYESLGFAGIAIRPGYYQPDNVDAVVMRLLREERR